MSTTALTLNHNCPDPVLLAVRLSPVQDVCKDGQQLGRVAEEGGGMGAQRGLAEGTPRLTTAGTALHVG